jgi:hypothetical protein
MTNSYWQEHEINRLQKQVNDIKAKQMVDHLHDTIVPNEAFMRSDGTVDIKAKTKEVSDIISKGYPNEFINDPMLIKLYSGVLRERDIERRQQQRMTEMKERTQTAESLRKQFPPTFKDKHSTVVIT